MPVMNAVRLNSGTPTVRAPNVYQVRKSVTRPRCLRSVRLTVDARLLAVIEIAAGGGDTGLTKNETGAEAPVRVNRRAALTGLGVLAAAGAGTAFGATRAQPGAGGAVATVQQPVSTGGPPPPWGPRARDLPARVGPLTATTRPPAVQVSGANAPSALPDPVSLTEASPLLTVLGARLTRALDPQAALPDSVSPISANSFQPYAVEFDTDAPMLEFGYRAVGGRYRIWIDDQPTVLTPVEDAGGGAFFRTLVTFGDRALRHVRFEVDGTRFTEVVVGRADTVLPAPRRGLRAVIVGDSFVEGTGAAARFTGFAPTLGRLVGWGDVWASGSGGTGYLTSGPGTGTYTGRVAYRDRIAADCLAFSPQVVMVTGGRNDSRLPQREVQAEALALFSRIRADLASAQLIVTSVFPASAVEAQSRELRAVSDAISTSAEAAGAVFLDVMGPNAYITGDGRDQAPTGRGNSDVLTSADGVHPTQLGHEVLARALLQRYAVTLPV